ncbi:MAG: DMT family transporter, partial [Anaerolineae bacterium]|nr:DMT family transporter [Anaerolineae bacterium]
APTGLSYPSCPPLGGFLMPPAMREVDYFTCETTGLQYTSASKASLIVATIPLAVLCLSALFLRERPTWPVLAGLALSIVGMLILIAGDPQFGWVFGGPMFGDFLMFGAVMSMAVYIIVMKNLAQARSALDVTELQIFYGALFFAPAFFWELPHVQWAAVSGRSLVALVCLTLFATIGAFVCYNYALSKISSTKTAIFLNCVPVVTAIGAWAILQERLTLLQMTGGLLVLFSVYLTNFRADQPLKLHLKRIFLAFRGLP